MIEQLLFWLFALGAVGSSLTMITRRMPVHSAVAFLGTLVSLAGLFFLLWAPFVAVMQIIIYAGAILVLFLFVIMLLHAHSGETPQQRLKLPKPLSIALALALLVGVSLALVRAEWGPPKDLEGIGTAQAVGTELFQAFLLPFEVASLILLIGVLGAVVLGKRDTEPLPPAERDAPPEEIPEPKEEVKV